MGRGQRRTRRRGSGRASVEPRVGAGVWPGSGPRDSRHHLEPRQLPDAAAREARAVHGRGERTEPDHTREQPRRDRHEEDSTPFRARGHLTRQRRVGGPVEAAGIGCARAHPTQLLCGLRARPDRNRSGDEPRQARRDTHGGRRLARSPRWARHARGRREERRHARRWRCSRRLGSARRGRTESEARRLGHEVANRTALVSASRRHCVRHGGDPASAAPTKRCGGESPEGSSPPQLCSCWLACQRAARRRRLSSAAAPRPASGQRLPSAPAEVAVQKSPPPSG